MGNDGTITCDSCGVIRPSADHICPECGSIVPDQSMTAGTRSVVLASQAEVPATVQDGSDSPPAIVRAAALAITLWQMPAVRVAVKTGATAMAASLALRAARGALRREVVTPHEPGLLAQLDDLVSRDSSRSSRERHADVIDTVIYVRRTIVR